MCAHVWLKMRPHFTLAGYLYFINAGPHVCVNHVTRSTFCSSHLVESSFHTVPQHLIPFIIVTAPLVERDDAFAGVLVAR